MQGKILKEPRSLQVQLNRRVREFGPQQQNKEASTSTWVTVLWMCAVLSSPGFSSSGPNGTGLSGLRYKIKLLPQREEGTHRAL